MINNVVLTGRLTKDIDLRQTPNGKASGSFSLAVERNFTNQQGQRDADFISCQAWGKTAETMANYTHKGSLIGIEGRIQTRNYENKQGQRVYVTEVIVNNFTFLESKKSQGQGGQGYQQANNQGNQGYQDQAWGSGQSDIDIDDGDLPF